MSENDTIPAPESKKPDMSWAAALAADRSWVLHTGSRTISRVKKFWDGELEVYTSTYNNQPTKGPVLELEDGNSFVARSEADFVSMEEKEVQFFQFVEMKISELATQLATVAVNQGMGIAKGGLLLGTAFRNAARATDMAIAQAGRRKPDVRP
jgi:hypothetical protein